MLVLALMLISGPEGGKEGASSLEGRRWVAQGAAAAKVSGRLTAVVAAGAALVVVSLHLHLVAVRLAVASGGEEAGREGEVEQGAVVVVVVG